MIVRDVSPLPDQFSIFQLSFSFDFFSLSPSRIPTPQPSRTPNISCKVSPSQDYVTVCKTRLFSLYILPWLFWSGFISVRKGGNDEVLFPVSRKEDVAFMFFFPSLSYFFAIFGHVSSSNSPIFYPPSSCSISGGKKRISSKFPIWNRGG